MCAGQNEEAMNDLFTADEIDRMEAILLDDMAETLDKAQGVGLAAPQVGVLRRLVIINVYDETGIHELINPEIIWKSEETQRVQEDCLSCPGEWGYTIRPKTVRFKVQDRKGEWFEQEVSDLFAQAVCHELDHLDGKLFLDEVVEFIDVDEQEQE